MFDTRCSVYIHLIPIEVSHPVIVGLGLWGTHTAQLFKDASHLPYTSLGASVRESRVENVCHHKSTPTSLLSLWLPSSSVIRLLNLIESRLLLSLVLVKMLELLLDV